ncbi:unnamed protein product, partial [Ilex paraguariensis]
LNLCRPFGIQRIQWAYLKEDLNGPPAERIPYHEIRPRPSDIKAQDILARDTSARLYQTR